MTRVPEPIDDDVLFLAWKAGDEQAFHSIVDRHGPALLGFLRHAMGDSEAADDAWSETWIRVIRGRDNYTPNGLFRAWLFTLGRRTATDLHRKRERWSRLRTRIRARWPRVTGEECGPLEQAQQNQEADLLRHALALLSEEQRTLLLLLYRQDMSPTEAGVVLGGFTAEQVRSRVKYARKLLKNQLEEALRREE